MTEIPEHLLKRSRERRGALGEGGDAAAPASTPASTPATTTPATPAVPAPKAAPVVPKVKPDPPYVAAAKARKKMPFWAMGALSLLPVWGFMYLRALQPEVKTVQGPLASGASVYNVCSGCHGGGGEGGSGRKLSEGEVLKTFPKIEDQLNLVAVGSEAYAKAGVPYGDPAREGGARVGGYNGAYMPARGGNSELTDAQILAVVCHERYTLGGADPTSDTYSAEFAKWCAPDAENYAKVVSGELTFESSELGVGITARASVPKG